MRRAARTDNNQVAIVSILRAVGATVEITSDVGRGFPDLVVGYAGVNHLLEVKNPDVNASHRRLSADEARWHSEWRGRAVVVHNADEALAVLGIRRPS